jgi:hypothetical protein
MLQTLPYRTLHVFRRNALSLNHMEQANDSSVGVAKGRNVSGSIPGSARFFSSSQSPDQLWGSLRILASGFQGPFPRAVKRPWLEADHSRPSNAEVKKGGAKPSFSIHLHGIVLIKHRDNFTFYLSCACFDPYIDYPCSCFPWISAVRLSKWQFSEDCVPSMPLCAVIHSFCDTWC